MDSQRAYELTKTIGCCHGYSRNGKNEERKRNDNLERVHNAIFDIVDQNHDGHVTLEEYKIFMEASDHKSDVAEATFKVLDKNKNGKIERKELIAGAVKFWCDLHDQDTKGMLGDRYD